MNPSTFSDDHGWLPSWSSRILTFRLIWDDDDPKILRLVVAVEGAVNDWAAYGRRFSVEELDRARFDYVQFTVDRGEKLLRVEAENLFPHLNPARYRR